ncbi:MAG: DUF2935 domain-containing protein [Epulopiscium sp.]|nr:DUF2935 domain-containing protein [Candidatus Epulonipiscium sp.]
MDPREYFIRQSLELNLFFARIMKEHLIFLEAGFTPRDVNLARQADMLKDQFTQLLTEAVRLSRGVVRQEVLISGEIVTPYTLQAERVTQFYTGIFIDPAVTQAEMMLQRYPYMQRLPMIDQQVFMLNHKAIGLVAAIIQFKEYVLKNVLGCRLFTVNYPLLIDHILREARLYHTMLNQLQSYNGFNIEGDLLEQELFWNRIMAEHSKFIRGLLDPTEEKLMETANDFAKEFDELIEEAQEAVKDRRRLPKVTEESREATESIRDFKAQGTEGLLQCKIKSIILPLLGDHTLREANHYLRILKTAR